MIHPLLANRMVLKGAEHQESIDFISKKKIIHKKYVYIIIMTYYVTYFDFFII